jgi:hypothetical protein
MARANQMQTLNAAPVVHLNALLVTNYLDELHILECEEDTLTSFTFCLIIVTVKLQLISRLNNSSIKPHLRYQC